MRARLMISASLLGPVLAVAQGPVRHPTEALEVRYARSQPVIHYSLHVSAEDLSGFSVEMKIRNAPDTFRIAMNAHPEYDDKYWRYLEGMRIEPAAGARASVTRLDSALWRVVVPGGAGTVKYTIKLPPTPMPRSAWKPFLSPTGGLVGGPHSFLYVVGATLAPSHVTVDIPAGWKIATGLVPTADENTFFAPTVDALVEGPLFVGRFSDWRFAVDGVPHRVVYWRAANAPAFDSTALVRDIQAIVEQGVAMFGRPPWREYTFVLQDSAVGGLEHPNSVTLGAPAADLARNPHAYLQEIAHEFTHAWNLMRIRPAEYRAVDYRPQPPTSGLWFSEGLTIFYADLFARRAGLPRPDSTRIVRLEGLLGRYHGSPGALRLSAERVSRAAYNAEPTMLGDYTASTHLQGEIIGTMLDIAIRDATDGRKSMDDVMRIMLDRFSGARGFVGADIQQVVQEVCRCDVTAFFANHIRAGSPIDYNRFLGLIGLRGTMTEIPAVSRTGAPVLDLNLWSYDRPTGMYARISSPTTPWGRAGLHTGDKILSVNGRRYGSWPEFRAFLMGLKLGDTVRFVVERPTGQRTIDVGVERMTQPAVRIEPLPNQTEKMRRLREAWLAGR